MAEVRVPMASALTAFGVAATVTRPSPDDTPIATSVIWITPTMDDFSAGSDLQRRTRRRIATLDRDAVATVPKGTLIEAPEREGEGDVTWIVESKEFDDADHHRVVVVRREDV